MCDCINYEKNWNMTLKKIVKLVLNNNLLRPCEIKLTKHTLQFLKKFKFINFLFYQKVKIESRCNNLMNYSTKQLNAFAALLFFDDR